MVDAYKVPAYQHGEFVLGAWGARIQKNLPMIRGYHLRVRELAKFAPAFGGRKLASGQRLFLERSLEKKRSVLD